MSILNKFQLNDKVALITGAARGLGQAMAVGLAEAGAEVVVLDRANLDETASQIETLGRKCLTLAIDISGMTRLRAGDIVGQAVSGMGRLDILVNNAGIIRRAPAIDFGEEDWQQVLDINLNSVFYLSQAAAKHYIAAGQGGKIINMASMLSYQGGLMVPSYTATKSAISGLTRALANEWAGQGINVNAIAPGYLKTNVTAGIRSDLRRNQAILDRVPAGRWGEPEDLMGMVVFLASEAANYVHGSIFPVDGGWLAR